MKISRLDLTAFKSFAGVTLDLRAPRTFIAGLNGVGKTSVREAIRYVLTGKCQGLDGKGSGADLLAPTFAPADGVKASAWIDGLGSVTRTWLHGTSGLEVEGFTGTATEQQAALYARLGTSEAFLSAALDSSVFLHLHHADAKALVLALLNVTVTIPQPEGSDHASGIDYTLDQLDAAYAKAFEDRKAAKQRVKGAFVPEKPVPPPTSVDLAAIGSRLKELRGQLATEAAAIAGTEGQKAVLDRQYAAALQIPVLPAAPEDLDAQIDALEERLALMEADAVVEPAKPAVGVHFSSDPTQIRKNAEILKAFDPKDGCVLDNGIKCPVAKLKFVNRGKDLIDALPAEVPRDTVPPVNPMTAVRKDLDALKDLQTRVAQAVAATQAQTEAQQRIHAEMVALPDVSAAQARIAKLQEQIRKGEAIQTAAQTYHAALTAYEQALTHKQTLEAEVTRLEGLVQVLGPSGARVKALGDALGSFEAAVNASLTPFGWAIHFEVEPWTAIVNGRPVETYSRSEQHRIGIALQVAIAELAGLGVVVVDELDMLSGANRETMGLVLLKAPIDQVVILSTREDDLALPRATAQFGVYRIGRQDNRSVILERGAA